LARPVSLIVVFQAGGEHRRLLPKQFGQWGMHRREIETPITGLRSDVPPDSVHVDDFADNPTLEEQRALGVMYDRCARKVRNRRVLFDRGDVGRPVGYRVTTPDR
jgi:hypothetical protein